MGIVNFKSSFDRHPSLRKEAYPHFQPQFHISHQPALAILSKLLASLDRQDGLDMGHLDPAIAIGAPRQHLGGFEHVLDLPAVEIDLGEGVELGGAQAAGLADEGVPDVAAAGGRQGGVLHADVDAGVEGVVDVADAVGGEEEDALVVLEDAQEDGDHLVALEVGGGAGLEEDVGLVEQQHGVPLGHHLEDRVQRLLDPRRVQPQVPRRHHVQRHAHVLRHALRRQRLAHPRRAREEHDHPPALALDHVVERVLVLDLALHKREDQLLLLVRQHQRLEGVVAELDRVDLVHEEDEPLLVPQRVATHEGDREQQLSRGQWSVFRLPGGLSVIRWCVDVSLRVLVARVLRFIIVLFPVGVFPMDNTGGVAFLRSNWVEVDGIIGQETVVCLAIDDDSAIDGLLDQSASAVGERDSLVGHEVVAGKIFKDLASHGETLDEISLPRVKVQGKDIQTRDGLRALEFIIGEILPIGAKFLTIPIHRTSLESEELHSELLIGGIAVVLKGVEALFALIGTIYQDTRFEDSPKVFERDDAICNKIIFGRNSVLQLHVQNFVEQPQVISGSLVRGGF